MVNRWSMIQPAVVVITFYDFSNSCFVFHAKLIKHIILSRNVFFKDFGGN